MKWPPVLISFIFLVLGLLVGIMLGKRADAVLDTPDPYEKIQIGFYDLLSQQKEIYNAHMTAAAPGAIVSTVTRPDDDRFIVKGKFIRKQQSGQRLYYDYTPLLYQNPTSNQMIDERLDYLAHNSAYLNMIEMGEQVLGVGKNGMIFLYQPQKKPEPHCLSLSTTLP